MMSESCLIIGAGHQGLTMAAHLALHGVEVNIWNRTQKNIEEVQNTGKIVCNGIMNGEAKIGKVSTDIKTVLSRCIMVTTPSDSHPDIARMLAPVLEPDTVIILNPGRTFGAIEFWRILKEMGCKNMPILAETQTIVYTCRKMSASSVNIYAMKKDVLIAPLRNRDKDIIIERMPRVLQPYFKWCDSILKTSLGNVGMVLHCAPVLLNIGWIESSKWEFKYYYDGISPTIAAYLEKIDKERVEVGRRLGVELESVVEWMKRTYQIEGEDLFSCLQNNLYYRDIDAPLSLKHRYIEEDIPCGLVPLEYIGKELKMDMAAVSLLIDMANMILDRDFRKVGRKVSKKQLDMLESDGEY